MVYKCNENTAGPRIMPTLFVITSKDSCLYQLANGKIGFIICYALFCLKLRNLSNNHWGLNCIMQPFQQMTYRCVLIETIHKTHFLVKKARYVQRQWALVYVKMGHYSVCTHTFLEGHNSYKKLFASREGIQRIWEEGKLMFSFGWFNFTT